MPAPDLRVPRATATLARASWRRGGVATQRPAKPFTPVRFRSSPWKVPGNRQFWTARTRRRPSVFRDSPKKPFTPGAKMTGFPGLGTPADAKDGDRQRPLRWFEPTGAKGSRWLCEPFFAICGPGCGPNHPTSWQTRFQARSGHLRVGMPAGTRVAQPEKVVKLRPWARCVAPFRPARSQARRCAAAARRAPRPMTPPRRSPASATDA
jgi:hypothetical protein